MTKQELTNAVLLTKDRVREALQMVYDTLNHGQQKKIIADEKVKQLFDLYGVQYIE